jgi:hypothetical protein
MFFEQFSAMDETLFSLVGRKHSSEKIFIRIKFIQGRQFVGKQVKLFNHLFLTSLSPGEHPIQTMYV